MSMNLFDQGADQRFAIQSDTVFGLHLGNDFGDMKGLWALRSMSIAISILDILLSLVPLAFLGLGDFSCRTARSWADEQAS